MMICHVIPLILCLVTLSYTTGVSRSTPLQCQECSTNITKYDGMSLGGTQIKRCSQRTCDDKCVSGHASISYIQDFEGYGSITVEIVMDYFKGCGDGFSSCDELKKMVVLQVGDDGREVRVEGCEMEACEEENCNDKTPDEINPDRLKPISCYMCVNATMNGTWNADDIMECKEENQVTCMLGVETCGAGNMDYTTYGTKFVYEYIKSCGLGDSSTSTMTFEEMKRIIRAIPGPPERLETEYGKVNLQYCTGELCNTQTAKEAKEMRNGGFPPSFLGSAIATIILLHLTFF